MKREVRRKYGYDYNRYPFEKEDVIDLDTFSKGRLLHWISMEKHNSLEIRKFIAEYFLWKYPDDVFWIQILEKEGLL
jgi:hypothetical protein